MSHPLQVSTAKILHELDNIKRNARWDIDLEDFDTFIHGEHLYYCNPLTQQIESVHNDGIEPSLDLTINPGDVLMYGDFNYFACFYKKMLINIADFDDTFPAPISEEEAWRQKREEDMLEAMRKSRTAHANRNNKEKMKETAEEKQSLYFFVFVRLFPLQTTILHVCQQR